MKSAYPIAVRTACFLSVLFFLPAIVRAGETPVRRLTPIMGWSSWNSFGSGVDAAKVRSQMEALVRLGLRDLGWTYVNIDDCYQNGRDPQTGRLRINLEKFPRGYAEMKAIADEAHAMGLKAGIYSDGGDNSCASGNRNPTGLDVGLYRHEEDDLNMFLGEGVWRDAWAKAHPGDAGVTGWGYDFIKIDWCGGGHARLDDAAQYGKILDAIEALERRVGRDKIVNICRWAYVGPWQFRADSWRSGPDIDRRGDSWESVMTQVDIMKGLWPYTRPGSMNDPDMLVAGLGMTPDEDRSHVAMWCLFSSPMLIGQDLRHIRPDTLALYKNTELIALNQDPAVLSAAYLGELEPGVEIWLKPLGDARSPERALGLLNRSARARKVTLRYERLGYTGKVAARDLFAHADIAPSRIREVTLPPHGIDVLRLKPAERGAVCAPRVDAARDAAAPVGDPERAFRVDWVNARREVERGAVLLDVRSREEFAAGHVPGARNVPHTEIIRSGDALPGTNTPVVCYCRVYKRAAQAMRVLLALGYRRVRFVGDGYDTYAARPTVGLGDVNAFLSDVKKSPWNNPWPNGRGKPDTSWNGKPINIRGITYRKGFGTDVDPRGGGVVTHCNVPAGATHFVSVVGRDRDDANARDKANRFSVYFDGALAAESPEIGWDDDWLFAVKIPAGAKRLKLLTTGPYISNHASWGGAGFVIPKAGR